MGMRPAMASTPPVGEVQNAPVIHNAALCDEDRVLEYGNKVYKRSK